MIAPTFQIKIALIGHVSVGKTTLLNAILRNMHSEVSMRRTTAGVNYFCLYTCKEGVNVAENTNGNDTSILPNDLTKECTTIPNEIRSAESTLKEIAHDNKALRNENEVAEKYFDIEIEKDICEMRSDTHLVVVEIPGINEAGATTKYTKYIQDKWDTFDCAVVVMDAKLGVNTDDHLTLLSVVQKNLQERKNIPVIIVANKVDEPDDKEQALLLSELCATIEKTFAVSCRMKALQEIVDGGNVINTDTLFPAFISMSAVHAYIYRAASTMDQDRFQQFDVDLIDKIGREEIGRTKWKGLSEEEHYQTVFKIVTDADMCTAGLQTSNYDKFIQVLTFAVGGMEKQTELIKKQIDVEAAKISCKVIIMDQLEPLIARKKKLGLDSIGDDNDSLK
jgi:GTPase SAR1 family protein